MSKPAKENRSVNNSGHIVFDCDGTLVSTMEGIYKLLQDFLTKLTNRKVSREEVINNLNYNSMIMLDSFGVASDENLRLMEEEWYKFHTTRESDYYLFDGILPLLRHLKAKGHKLYVWTGRERPSTLEILKKLNVLHYFEDINCRGDNATAKPALEGLRIMLYDAKPEETVIIGDSYADILGAKNFKAHGIGALWCENAREDILKDYGADAILSHPDQCKDYIDNLFK